MKYLVFLLAMLTGCITNSNVTPIVDIGGRALSIDESHTNNQTKKLPPYTFVSIKSHKKLDKLLSRTRCILYYFSVLPKPSQNASFLEILSIKNDFDKLNVVYVLIDVAHSIEDSRYIVYDNVAYQMLLSFMNQYSINWFITIPVIMFPINERINASYYLNTDSYSQIRMVIKNNLDETCL